jgi:hypothetical protein
MVVRKKYDVIDPETGKLDRDIFVDLTRSMKRDEEALRSRLADGGAHESHRKACL